MRLHFICRTFTPATAHAHSLNWSLNFSGKGGRRRQRALHDRFEMPARAIRKDFGKRLVSEITSKEIDNWLRNLKVSPVTRNNSRRVLRTAFSFAHARNYCVDNPVVKTAKAKEIEGTVGILTVAETARLLEAADSKLVPFDRDRAFRRFTTRRA